MLEKIILFVDNISIKNYRENTKELIQNSNGCRRFVNHYIEEVEKILKRFEEVDLNLCINKSKFRIDEIVVVGYLCGRYDRKSNLKKVDAIARIKVYNSITKIKIFEDFVSSIRFKLFTLLI